MQIPVSHPWPSNARLLTDAVFPILRTSGLWDEEDTALDVTYHTGTWWSDYRPNNFVYHTRLDDPDFDFRSLPHPDSSFDLIAFDPPYIAKGGPSLSAGFDDRFDQRYGVSQRIRPDDLLEMNREGLKECLRVGKNVVLMKSMDFVSEGVLHCHTSSLELAANQAGWRVYERFIHVPVGARPQPQNKRVLRGRSRPSTMTVLVPDSLKRGHQKRMKPLSR